MPDNMDDDIEIIVGPKPPVVIKTDLRTMRLDDYFTPLY